MRVTSDIFVSSITRRCFSDGGAAVVENKGALEAGAIYLRILHKDRTQSLYGPAPQSMFDDDIARHDRLFELRLSKVAEYDVNEKLAREKSFDEDIWIVELETDNPELYFNVITDEA